jgi:hypothetical protein
VPAEPVDPSFFSSAISGSFVLQAVVSWQHLVIPRELQLPDCSRSPTGAANWRGLGRATREREGRRAGDNPGAVESPIKVNQTVETRPPCRCRVRTGHQDPAGFVSVQNDFPHLNAPQKALQPGVKGFQIHDREVIMGHP